jgi:hypothetical protein
MIPRFEFIVKDKALALDCFRILVKQGFSPRYYYHQNIFKVGLYDSKQVVELVNQTKDYFLDDKKIRHVKEICTDGIGL